MHTQMKHIFLLGMFLLLVAYGIYTQEHMTNPPTLFSLQKDTQGMQKQIDTLKKEFDTMKQQASQGASQAAAARAQLSATKNS